jgi:hypothetical protein
MTMPTMCSVLGEERTVLQVNPGDGFPWFNCPFCTSAVYVGAAHPDHAQHFSVAVNGVCTHPWCIANPAMPVKAAEEIVAKELKRTAAEVQRQRDHDAAMHRIKEGQQARQQRAQALEVEANVRGACHRCAQATGKFIRHRGACPRALKR